jgi:1,2-diacylglycerol 3-alpha-glucosyltransferase/glucuronosyltransferase
MKIALVTDAWLPQTNGVVRTLSITAEQLRLAGHTVETLEPGLFRTVPCPTYPEIRLALWPGRELSRRLRALDPDAVHIATEGPLGLAARRWCLHHSLRFTTSYHTQFPEYVRARVPLPISWTYAHLRRFHGAAAHTLVATPSMMRQLESRGFSNLALWSRGVDTDVFQPRGKQFIDLPRPIWLYFGRLAVEKGIEDFLALDLPGSKLVVGDGPATAELKRRYGQAHYAGYRYGVELAQYVSSADVFVFPSRTDTFGLVLLEAMACGIPVAAYPVTGPRDVVVDGVTGALDVDLKSAALRALGISADACRSHALRYTWQAATQQFVHYLAARSPAPVSAAPVPSSARVLPAPADSCRGP